MAKFAALPLFTDALIADTSHLTDEEFGKYMRLLIVTWRSPLCKIPNDLNWISKRLSVDPLRYNEVVLPILDEFFTKVDGGSFFTQKRLKKEFSYIKMKRKKQVMAAKSRWDKDKSDKKRICERNAPSPTPSPTPSTVKKDPLEIPSFIDSDTWLDFVNHRGGKKFTRLMATRIIKQLTEWHDKGHNVNDVLNTSIMNGWKGVFEPETKGSNNNGRQKLADEAAELLEQYGDTGTG